MIMSTYLGLSDQTLVERHKRVYGNIKIIKWWSNNKTNFEGYDTNVKPYPKLRF
jgi:hypothetical protein